MALAEQRPVGGAAETNPSHADRILHGSFAASSDRASRVPMVDHLRSPASRIPTRKVAFLTTADNVGGMERVVCGLAREFTTRAWNVQAVFPRTPKSQALLNWCRDQGVAAQAHPAVLDAAAPHSNRALLRLSRFVRRSRADIVNIHYGDNFISLKDVLAVRLAGKHRCMVTLHQAVAWDVQRERKRKMTRLAASFCDKVIAICHATRAVLLEAGVPAHKICLIPCGVPVPERLPTRAEARARLGLPGHVFLVVSMANLVPRKGLADLIEAAARVPDPRGELVVAIAGDGPERTALENLAAVRLRGRAVFLGPVLGDTADVYAAADVFALTSYREGLPLVYLESAFHGVPCIGTDVGGTSEVVRDGRTGVLVQPGDPAAVAVAIQRLRDDPALRSRLGDAARAHAHAELTESVMADRYEQLFASSH